MIMASTSLVKTTDIPKRGDPSTFTWEPENKELCEMLQKSITDEKVKPDTLLDEYMMKFLSGVGILENSSLTLERKTTYNSNLFSVIQQHDLGDIWCQCGTPYDPLCTSCHCSLTSIIALLSRWKLSLASFNPEHDVQFTLRTRHSTIKFGYPSLLVCFKVLLSTKSTSRLSELIANRRSSDMSLLAHETLVRRKAIPVTVHSLVLISRLVDEALASARSLRDVHRHNGVGNPIPRTLTFLIGSMTDLCATIESLGWSGYSSNPAPLIEALICLSRCVSSDLMTVLSDL